MNHSLWWYFNVMSKWKTSHFFHFYKIVCTVKISSRTKVFPSSLIPHRLSWDLNYKITVETCRKFDTLAKSIATVTNRFQLQKSIIHLLLIRFSSISLFDLFLFSLTQSEIDMLREILSRNGEKFHILPDILIVSLC